MRDVSDTLTSLSEKLKQFRTHPEVMKNLELKLSTFVGNMNTLISKLFEATDDLKQSLDDKVSEGRVQLQESQELLGVIEKFENAIREVSKLIPDAPFADPIVDIADIDKVSSEVESDATIEGIGEGGDEEEDADLNPDLAKGAALERARKARQERGGGG